MGQKKLDWSGLMATENKDGNRWYNPTEAQEEGFVYKETRKLPTISKTTNFSNPKQLQQFTKKMTKFCIFVAAFALVSCCLANPIGDYHGYHEIQETEHKKQIPILKQDFEQHHEGYQFSYETGNGISRQEHGFIKNKGDKKHETLVQQGTITYHDEHGHPITLTYIADEHGFQPQGSHLPTPPPIPAEIAKALEEKAHQSYQQPSQDHLDYQHQYEHY